MYSANLPPHLCAVWDLGYKDIFDVKDLVQEKGSNLTNVQP